MTTYDVYSPPSKLVLISCFIAKRSSFSDNCWANSGSGSAKVNAGISSERDFVKAEFGVAGCKLQAGSVWLSMGSSALMVKICCTVIFGKSELIVYKSSLSFSPPVTTTDRQFSWVHESSATLSCLKVMLTRSTVSYAIKPSQSTSLIVTDSLNGTKLWR